MLLCLQTLLSDFFSNFSFFWLRELGQLRVQGLCHHLGMVRTSKGTWRRSLQVLSMETCTGKSQGQRTGPARRVAGSLPAQRLLCSICFGKLTLKPMTWSSVVIWSKQWLIGCFVITSTCMIRELMFFCPMKLAIKGFLPFQQYSRLFIFVIRT